MGSKSPKVGRAPSGTIDPAHIDNTTINPDKRTRLLKSQHLPSVRAAAALLDVTEHAAKKWLTGMSPMPVEFFYALVRHLDVGPAKAMLMAEEIYHRRVRRQQLQEQQAKEAGDEQ